MEQTLKQAKDFWQKGDLSKCIKILQKLSPQNDELNEIASAYNENEKFFLRGLIELSAYNVARTKIRLRLQEYFQNVNTSAYRIFYIASNPTQLVQLNYGKEYETIKQVLEGSDFQLSEKFSANKLDLPDKIKKYSPNLVYISLHGTNNNELMFADEYGRTDKLTADELIKILKNITFSANPDCIFFSACKSDEQAKTAAGFVSYSIGMKEEIDDMAGVVFAKGFFTQLVNSPEKIEEAFEYGKMYLELNNNPSIKQCAGIPQLFNKNKF